MFRKHNLFFAVVASACSLSAEAASVSGQFALGGKPLKPTEVAAFRMRDQFHPRDLETYVMLTTKPVNKDKIKDSIDPYAVAINDPAAFGDGVDYIALSISADGKTGLNAHVGGVQYVDSSGTIMGQQGSLSAICKENTATRIACTVKTTKEVKPMDGPAWTLDVSFDTEVLSRPAGKPMAKDGEAPGKALIALRSAVAGNDFAKILALLAPDKAKSYNEDYNTPAENLKSAKEILDARLPKQLKITGGEWLADDHALLEVEGVPYANGRMLYLVDMRRIDGAWLWEDSSPAGMLQ
jgi:hypothetical protein